MGAPVSRRRVPPNAAVCVVVVLGALALAVAFAVVLSQKGQLSLGTNRVSQPQFVRTLPAGERFCQAGEVVPAGAGLVRFRIGTHGPPGPPLTVSFYRGPRLVTSGRLRQGWPQGDIEVPIRPIGRTTPTDRMCIRNGGKPLLAFAGERDIVRTDYLAAESKTWWARAGAINDRFDEGKSDWFGGWTLALALGLVLSAAGLTAVTAIRRIR